MRPPMRSPGTFKVGVASSAARARSPRPRRSATCTSSTTSRAPAPTRTTHANTSANVTVKRGAVLAVLEHRHDPARPSTETARSRTRTRPRAVCPVGSMTSRPPASLRDRAATLVATIIRVVRPTVSTRSSKPNEVVLVAGSPVWGTCLRFGIVMNGRQSRAAQRRPRTRTIENRALATSQLVGGYWCVIEDSGFKYERFPVRDS